MVTSVEGIGVENVIAEHYWNALTAVVLGLLGMLTYQQSNVSSQGLLEAGPPCRKEAGCGWVWGSQEKQHGSSVFQVSLNINNNKALQFCTWDRNVVIFFKCMGERFKFLKQTLFVTVKVSTQPQLETKYMVSENIVTVQARRQKEKKREKKSKANK